MTTTTADTAPPPQSQDVQQALAQQALRAAELLVLERAAVKAVTWPLHVQIVAIQRAAMKAWIAAFGSTKAPGDPIRAAAIVADLRGQLARIDTSSAAALGDWTDRALDLGATQAIRAVGAARASIASPAAAVASAAIEAPGAALTVDDIAPAVDDVTARITAGLEQSVRAQLDTAESALTQTAATGSFTDVDAALGKARRATSTAERDTVTAMQGAANSGRGAVAVALGADMLWLAEPDACCVPGTRVSAPMRLRPSQSAAGIVASDVADRLAAYPSARGVAGPGDCGLPATSAVAEAVGDLSGVLGVSQRDYRGKVITVITASGKEFTGTPNHPVATRTGWVGLSELHVGDYVFSRSRVETSGSAIDPDLDDVQPRIEEVAEALQRVVASCVVPVASEDFHNDGAGTEVGVVWSHRLLGDRGNPTLSQHLRECCFDRASVAPGAFNRSGLCDSRLDAHPLALHDNGHAGGQLGALRFGELTSAAEVFSGGESTAFEPALDGSHVDAMDYRNFLERLAGLVEPDEVVEIRNGEFSGHVYNLETVEGWYLSQDIVSHNCTTCLGLAGRTAAAGQPFNAAFAATYTDKPHLWPAGPLQQPPAHPHCRCEAVPYLGMAAGATGPSLPEALQREAQRAVLKGWSLPSESNAERIRAARKALARNPRAPKTVIAGARRAVAAGKFPTRDVPHYAARPAKTKP